MRRKQHSNRHKRMRKAIESALEASGIPFANVYDRLLLCHMVKSKRMQVSVKKELSHDFPSLDDWGMPVQVFENTALQWTNSPESPRGIYLRVKARVNAIRRQAKDAGRYKALVRERTRARLEEAVRQVAQSALPDPAGSSESPWNSLPDDVRAVVGNLETSLASTRLQEEPTSDGPV